MKKKSYADMDPLEEVRAIKEEISREFKTVHAYGEYLIKKYPKIDTLKAASDTDNGNQSVAKPVKSRTSKTNRKTTKRLTPV